VTAEEGLSLRMTRVLPAPRERVWQAMTEPEQLAKWWGPKGFTTPSVEFGPRAGDSFRIAMQPPEGDLFQLSGELRELDSPARLAYTFRWDPPDPDDRETLVALSLEDRGDETAVQLFQGEFATEERRALHEDGWTDCFERLAELLG
jgi:uncharacterized protein YndB with AHSA1/START domain